jgi:hypothetical protein
MRQVYCINTMDWEKRTLNLPWMDWHKRHQANPEQ